MNGATDDCERCIDQKSWRGISLRAVGIPLSLDDELKRVLDWLDDRIGRWDMYVDLRGQTIRYCVRDLADASEFKRRFVMRETG